MNLRTASASDLPKLREIYAEIVIEMLKNGVDLWNEHYPYEWFPEDIAAERLWLLCDEEKIAAAFALDSFTDTGDVTWQQPDSPAMVLMRLGVDPAYQRMGLGARCVELAKNMARERGCKYLRLFVVDCNKPAEQFYIKCGFVRGQGEHTEVIPGLAPEGLTEYGYEIGV